MAFEEGTEILACQGCGTEHSARWSRMPVREWQRVDCSKCGEALVQGRSTRDYFQVSNLAD